MKYKSYLVRRDTSVSHTYRKTLRRKNDAKSCPMPRRMACMLRTGLVGHSTHINCSSLALLYGALHPASAALSEG